MFGDGNSCGLQALQIRCGELGVGAEDARRPLANQDVRTRYVPGLIVPSRASHRTVSSGDGVEIAYASWGEGHGIERPTVVLVHGWGGNRTYWASQVDYLAERHRVIALDLGGHGESGLGRSDWNLAAFGDDVVAVIEDAEARDVAMVGHSMGGDAIVHAARCLDDRVAGLVWIDVFRSLGAEPESPPDEVDAFVAPFRDDFRVAAEAFVRRLLPEGAEEELVDRISADMAGTPRNVTLGSLPYARNRQPAVLAALHEISTPIVAINPGTGSTDVDSMHRHGVETVILDGVGHFPMLEAPARLNPVLASALASFGI